MKININAQLFDKLNLIGAVALPVLSPLELETLDSESDQLPMKRREPETATGVTQDFFGCDNFPSTSKFWEIAKLAEVELNRELGKFQALCTPIEWNDYSLQRYPVSKPGQNYAISPHMDYKTCINVIAVFLLRGIGSFCICEDRSGRNPIEIEASPGDLIIMRGTCFNKSSLRPYHFIGPVTKERISFGLRQTVDKEVLPKFYNEG